MLQFPEYIPVIYPDYYNEFYYYKYKIHKIVEMYY